MSAVAEGLVRVREIVGSKVYLPSSLRGCVSLRDYWLTAVKEQGNKDVVQVSRLREDSVFW